MAQVLVGIPRNECLDKESVGARADLFQLDELAEMNEGPLSNFFLPEHDVQQLE